jgi:hypothetical protein
LILLSGSLAGYTQERLKIAPIKPLTGNQQFFQRQPLIGNQLKRNKPLNENQPLNRNQPIYKNKQIGPAKVVPPGTYLLAPDNMPCVVPDMAIIKPITNSIRPGYELPFIPNGYRRTPIVPNER